SKSGAAPGSRPGYPGARAFQLLLHAWRLQCSHDLFSDLDGELEQAVPRSFEGTAEGNPPLLEVAQGDIEAHAVFPGFQAAAQTVTGCCSEAMSKSRVLDLNGTGATQVAGDFIPDHRAEVIINPFGIPVLEIGDSDGDAPIEDLRDILASRNTDLHRI